MPGTSRMPVSLRESFNSVRRSRPGTANPLHALSLDLYVLGLFFHPPFIPSTPC